MKGIILAGGSGTRLYPITLSTSKQLLPIFDKPMIYYPLAVLMMAKIKEILIISTPLDLPRFEALFGDGSHLGISISYEEQIKPEGIAQAFLIAEDFIGKDSVSLILGDNIFYGHHLSSLMAECYDHKQGGIVFGYEVQDPSRYGVLEFNQEGFPINIIEKPQKAPSSYAVTGLYFYGPEVVEIAQTLKPSKRGELEITDVNQIYLERGALKVKIFDRGFAWLDTGTYEALQQASSYVQTIQERQGIKIGCIEEVAFENGWISINELRLLSLKYTSSPYGVYLQKIADRYEKNRSFSL